MHIPTSPFPPSHLWPNYFPYISLPPMWCFPHRPPHPLHPLQEAGKPFPPMVPNPPPNMWGALSHDEALDRARSAFYRAVKKTLPPNTDYSDFWKQVAPFHSEVRTHVMLSPIQLEEIDHCINDNQDPRADLLLDLLQHFLVESGEDVSSVVDLIINLCKPLGSPDGKFVVEKDGMARFQALPSGRNSDSVREFLKSRPWVTAFVLAKLLYFPQ